MHEQNRHFLVASARPESISSLVMPCRRFCSAKEDIHRADTRLYLYSKEGCHLCDGLKVVLHPRSHAMFMLCTHDAGA